MTFTRMSCEPYRPDQTQSDKTNISCLVLRAHPVIVIRKGTQIGGPGRGEGEAFIAADVVISEAGAMPGDFRVGGG